MSTFECNNQESNISPHHPFALFNNPRPVILRYGREELIALYRPHLAIPDEIKEIPEIFNKQELTPFSLSPASETEQRNLTQALCGGRVNLNFKSNPQRPHGNRLILNSASRYPPRANTTGSSHTYFNPGKSVEWPPCGDALSSPDAPHSPEETASSLNDMPSMFVAHSDGFNRLSRSKDFNKKPMDRRFPMKGGPIIAGSWRNSGNFKSDFGRRDFLADSDDQPGLPEWATESTSVDAREMTFDNQGKFVHVDALEENKTETACEDNNGKSQQKNAETFLPFVDNSQKKPENDPVCFDINLLKKHIDALTSRDATDQSQKKHLSMHETVEWFYIDPQRQIRGPFSAEQMSKWYSAGYFSSSILLRRSTDKKFSHLGEYVNALGPGFLFSLAPIKGFSEMIDAGLLSARSAETNGSLVSHAQSRSYLPGKNVRVDPHFQTASGNNLEGLLLDLLSQNSLNDRPTHNTEPKFVDPPSLIPIPFDARTDGIVERLGYNDPSIMAISSRGPQSLDTLVPPYGGKDKWQLALERSDAQLHSDLSASVQSESKLAPWADQMDAMTGPPKSFSAIQLEEMRLEKQLQRAAQKSNVEEAPAWRTMNTTLGESFSKIQLEEMRRQQAGMDAHNLREDVSHLTSVHAESKMAPWANQMEVMAVPSKSLAAIQLEELQLAKQQLQLSRAAAQRAASMEETPAPTWRTLNTGLGESLSKIQLEEMRRHQASLDESNRQPQFQQEGLNRLRQLQKPQEPKQENVNWANWSTRSAKIWEQELRNYQIRQAEEEQASRKPKSLTSNMNPSLVAWASEQLTSMYGPKIYADAVIHLLCKFNTASEMESFIRQSLGTHSKATEFSLNFHRRLLSDEQTGDAGASPGTTDKEKMDGALATDSLEADRSSSPSLTKKRNKKKGKRVHDSQLGFKPSSAE